MIIRKSEFFIRWSLLSDAFWFVLLAKKDVLLRFDSSSGVFRFEGTWGLSGVGALSALHKALCVWLCQPAAAAVPYQGSLDPAMYEVQSNLHPQGLNLALKKLFALLGKETNVTLSLKIFHYCKNMSGHMVTD